MRLTEGPAEAACTNVYLDDDEWMLLAALPARLLRKRRHLVRRDGLLVAIDEHEDGTLVAEIDDHDQPSDVIPEWLEVVEDVTSDEAWTGVALARLMSAAQQSVTSHPHRERTVLTGDPGLGRTAAS